MLKKLCAAILLAGFSFTVYSQNVEGINARIDAMAGCGMISDIGWAIGEPVGIINYPDLLSASLYATPIPDVGESFGAIIGVKSLGEHMRVALTLNDRMQMPYAFYKDGGYYLNAKHINGDNHAEKFPMYPSVAFAVKFNDDFSFGLGGWAEGQRYTLEETKKFGYGAGPNDTVTYMHNELDKRIGYYGFVVDGWVALGGLHIRPSFKLGLPFMSGREEDDMMTSLKSKLAVNPASGPLQAVDHDIEWEMPEGMKLGASALAWFLAGDHEIAFGLWYSDLKYQFQMTTKLDSVQLTANGAVDPSVDVHTTTVDKRSNRHMMDLFWFVGISPAFADNLIFAPEYNGGWGTFEAKDPATPMDTSWIHTFHNFRLGIEKGIPDVWIFDKLFVRSGVVMYLAKEYRTITDGDESTTESVEDIPWASYFWGSEFGRKQAKLAGGLGIKKARCEFDVSVDFLAWKGQGIIAGPNCAMVTLKVDFGSDKEF